MSVFMNLERPVVYAHLNQIRKRLGNEQFPLIPLTYYSHQSAMQFTPEYPFVVKVGSAEAGYGKMKFDNEESGFNDFRGCLALHNDYATIEKFVKNREYDTRVQRIGKHTRAYKRINANWKGNVGSCILEEIEVTPTFTLWADEVQKLFGGMDIFTVDAIHTRDGRDFILEINDSASGFAPSNLVADQNHVKELVLERLSLAH
eukprot:TRINITY_DN8440_c0_g1_i1.p1 TRINITY_DN8440_c0_g1~~TRINITY_DN8440_c0_g1_i1.p1  ORF type:complete len:203 (+),score=53.23 TRINITY_DN8440_c0_g1_i1:415-1023(+)